MKKYYYALDTYNRIVHITEDEIDYYSSIELEENDFKKINLFYHGIVNNKLVEIGKTKEEIENEQKQFRDLRILELKQLLIETDWKVVVNSERIQAGLPLKYPNLHQERQAWRDEINKLEQGE
jgi:hypothetical protein